MQITNLYKKRIVSAVVLCIMIFGIGYGLGELLRPSDYGYATDTYRKELQELKDKNIKVDLVLIGTSRVQSAFDPEIFENKLKFNKVYNLSVPQLNMEGLYYQLKDFIDVFHPKYVGIGITVGELSRKVDPKIVKLLLVERLHGINRLKYIWHSFSLADYPYLINIYSYRNNLSNIRTNIENKKRFQNDDTYMKTEKWESRKGGFLAFHKRIPQRNMVAVQEKRFDTSQIREKTLYYLNKSVKLCKDNGVRVFLVSPPTSMSHIYSISNFQDMVDYVTVYAKENNIPYYNLNYLKDREHFFPDSMLYDIKHINKYGAAIASSVFADILAKERKSIDTSDYFYTSVDELKRTVNRVVAVGAKPAIKNGIMRLSIQSFQNNDVVPSYQVLLAHKKNDFKTVVDWTGNKDISFDIPKGKRYRVLLRARHKENASGYAWMAWEVDSKGKIRKVNDVPESFYKLN